MKKILLFIDNLGSGGAQRQLVNLAILLKNHSYDVSMAVYGDNPFYKHILDDENIPVSLVKNNGTLSRILATRRFIRRAGADVVIAFLETPGFLACLAKVGGAKFKLVTNELSAKMSTFTSKRNRIFNFFERYSDAKICNSENAKKMWEKYYPQYKDKYGVIYNPVIIPAEENLSQSTPGGEKRRITVAASYQKLKNPLGVIEALNLLSPEERERLEIEWYGRAEVTTGNTEIYDRAQALIKEYGLSSCIRLNPETSEIYQKMAESDAVGLFSTVEGLPNAICEGMMLGKPIIMSRVSDYDVLTDGNGFPCDPTPESIKDALKEFLATPTEALKEMGDISRQKAMKLFSREAIAKQWVALIETLTKK